MYWTGIHVQLCSTIISAVLLIYVLQSRLFPVARAHVNVKLVPLEKVQFVLPMTENYIVSQLVYVTYPSISIHDQHGKVVLRGSGNAVVRLMSNSTSWMIEEAVWNVISI